MRRLVISFSAALLVLSIAPAGALARHHHHRRHHGRAHRVRVESFGSQVQSAPSGSSFSDNAGTVQSFQHGVLTIMLGDGSTVSGVVTNDTEIECMASGSDQTMHEDSDGGSPDQSGDRNSSGSGDDQSGSSGEDQGDAGEQNGDEAGNNCSTMNLTPGAVVREAELRMSGTGAAWKQVELAS